MSDFTVRSDNGRRRADHAADPRRASGRSAAWTTPRPEIRELASVKLEKFLDPRGVRSDLVDQFRRTRAAMPPPHNYEFEESTLFETHRGFLRWMRKLLSPILKLFFNPNPIIRRSTSRSELNTRNAKREELDALHYEVLHNLVLELTRVGIEVKNLKMRVESMSSRLDFDERRARALEGVVDYRAGAAAPRQPPAGAVSGRRRPRRPPTATPSGARAAPPPAAPARPAARGDGRQAAGRGRGTARGRCTAPTRAALPQPRPSGASPDRRPRPTREAGDRRAALRRRHQRRRRAARALHRGAARAPRRRRGRHDLRAGLRHLANELPPGVETINGVRSAASRSAHERVPREFGRLSARGLRPAALHRRRTALARQRRAGQPGADRPSPAADAVRLRAPLQLPLLPRLARGAAAAGRDPCWCRRRSATRPSAWHLRAGVPRRARGHVQLARGARDDPRRRPATSTVPGVVVGVGSEMPDRTSRGAVPPQVQRSPGRSRSTSGGSTRTRAAVSCSSSSSATPRRFPEGSTWC